MAGSCLKWFKYVALILWGLKNTTCEFCDWQDAGPLMLSLAIAASVGLRVAGITQTKKKRIRDFSWVHLKWNIRMKFLAHTLCRSNIDVHSFLRVSVSWCLCVLKKKTHISTTTQMATRTSAMICVTALGRTSILGALMSRTGKLHCVYPLLHPSKHFLVSRTLYFDSVEMAVFCQKQSLRTQKNF